MFYLLGLSIVLAVMLVLSTLVSLVSGLVWTVGSKRFTLLSPASRALTLFVLRTAPVGFGIASVFLLFGPAYMAYEPRQDHEDVSLNLAVMALISAVGLTMSLVKAIAAWRATSQLAAYWLKHAESIQLPNIKIPTYRIEHGFPLIAVVGAFRPRLFLAKKVFESLTPNELSAALDHENGHIVARDNLKRSLMRACRDLFFVPFGRELDLAWVEASETAADDYAARRGSKIGLDLASAMVKIARIIPDGARPTMAAGAFLVGDEGKIGFKARVSRLVQISDTPQNESQPLTANSGIMKWVPVGLILLVIGIVVTQPDVLFQVHQVIEHTVRILD